MDSGDGETRPEVLAVAAAAGFEVTETQLARWHRDRLLPRPRQQALGRGLGTATVYPANTAAQLVALCRVKVETRSLDMVAFELWWEGFPIDVDRIRPRVRRVAEELDAEIAAGPATSDRSPRASLHALMSRRLGRQRVHDIAEAVRVAATDPDGAIADIAEEFYEFPPTFDSLARRSVPLAGRLLAGAPAAQVVADATDAELVAARDKAKNFLTFLRDWAGLMAWLFGCRGETFRLFADMEQHLGAGDVPGLVVAFLMMEQSLPANALEFLSDPPATPELLGQLRTLKALQEQVPGAAEVFTPVAVRALLRGKEASRRHTPKIQRFVDAHREDVNRVIASLDTASEMTPLSGQPTRSNRPGHQTALPPTGPVG